MAAGAVRGGALATLRGLLQRPLASYYLLLSSCGLLLVIGLVMVFSATAVNAYAANGDPYAVVRKQIVFAAIGLVAFWAFQRMPPASCRRLGGPLLLVALGLLLVLDTLGMAATVHLLPSAGLGPIHADASNSNWLYVGPLQMQPSELAKLALVLWGSGVLADKGGAIGHWAELARPLFPVVGLLVLLVGFNDLGTTLCLMLVFLGLLWAAGVRMRVFATLGAAAVVGAGVLVALPGFRYRIDRLTSFANPSHCDPQSTCYQSLHGMYAIADGGWFGVGLGAGRLKWGWLPNGQNDFIFAVIAEELGVTGCCVVLALLAVLTYTGFRIARRVDDPFRRLAAAAVTVWLTGQALINIGGVTGLLPITGVPLPFISAGGSALV
ncbi:MAG TPA: putative peptidoglycan glycosyltransferase FtsW, partial [Rugosimonospora sp.]|nr:putative peptidoglycan glycosyltransferase FtsW [Rugosimonospora sp.]